MATRWGARSGPAAASAVGVALTAVLTLVTGTGRTLADAAAVDGRRESAGPVVRVLTVDNPQMVDLRRLTEREFTPRTGIRVVFDTRPENELRRAAAAELREHADAHDVISLGSYDLQVFAADGWLQDLDDVYGDPAFASADLLASVRASVTGADGRPYGVPFYGESSMLMYNREAARAAGVTVPDAPTWDDVAALAARMDGALPGMRGICLRGLPGWGQMMAPLMTVVNTFGGTLFDAAWRPRLTDPAFVDAVSFYVDLIRRHGDPGSPQAGYTECLRAMAEGRVALWYDSTAGAGILEDPDVSRVAGEVGYAAAPVRRTASSGWLWTWAWSLPRASTPDADALRFVSWAGSAEYESLAGQRLGWSRVPAGKRASTYARPEYAAQPFAARTLRAITAADPRRAGVQERPYAGIQFVPVPEFADLATDISQHVSAVLVGTAGLRESLASVQPVAERVGQRHRDTVEAGR
ncbi:MAG: extracellular solute-binding protein [Kineosporiaceae bacterium]